MSAKKNIFEQEVEESQHFVYQTGVDLRKQFDPAIDSKFLMPMAGVTHNIVKVHGNDVWALAKTIEYVSLRYSLQHAEIYPGLRSQSDKASLESNEPFSLTNYLLATYDFSRTAHRTNPRNVSHRLGAEMLPSETR
jgi:hypothetical protein